MHLRLCQILARLKCDVSSITRLDHGFVALEIICVLFVSTGNAASILID
jgi:hypothetical protein